MAATRRHHYIGGVVSTFLSLIGLVALCLFVWAAWVEPRWYKRRYFTVQIPNLSVSLKVVAVGDLQPNTLQWPENRLSDVFSDIAAKEMPDLVLWLGDYYNGHTGASGSFLNSYPAIRTWVEKRYVPMDQIARAMSLLPGRLGSFAVLGNHDWAWSGEKTAELLGQAGVSVLRDDIATVMDPENGQKVQIVGYEDLSSYRMPDYGRVHQSLDPGAAQIAMSHSPDAFDQAHGGPSLMLAGHTHGGQVRLPLLGALVLPVQNKAYDRGWFSERHRKLFVTTGLGSSIPPLRFLCRPEIVILTLEPLQVS